MLKSSEPKAGDVTHKIGPLHFNAEMAVLTKIERRFSNKVILKLKLTINVFYKKCGPKRILFNEKNSKKIQTIFGIKIDFECPHFMTFDTIVTFQHYRYQKNLWQRLIFLQK